MIKNDSQLIRTRARLQAVEQEIAELEAQYTGRELKVLVSALRDDAQRLSDEVEDYIQLRELSLQEAVEGPLSQPSLLDNIGLLLSKLRVAAGMTQEDLATRLGWKQSNLSRFESENYHSQTIGKVVKYASELGVWVHVAPSLAEEPMEVTFTREDALSMSFQALTAQWTEPLPPIASRAESQAAGLDPRAEIDSVIGAWWDVYLTAITTPEDVADEGWISAEYQSKSLMSGRVATTSLPSMHLTQPERPTRRRA